MQKLLTLRMADSLTCGRGIYVHIRHQASVTQKGSA